MTVLLDTDMVRCPGCNPIHELGARPGKRVSKKHKDRTCVLCKGTQRVSVIVSKRYLDALRMLPSEYE